jgi:hypothetical protein
MHEWIIFWVPQLDTPADIKKIPFAGNIEKYPWKYFLKLKRWPLIY